MTWLHYVHNVPLVFPEGGDFNTYPDHRQLFLDTYPPYIITTLSFHPDAGDLTLTGYGPSLGVGFPIPACSLELTGYGPSLGTGIPIPFCDTYECDAVEQVEAQVWHYDGVGPSVRGECEAVSGS